MLKLTNCDYILYVTIKVRDAGINENLTYAKNKNENFSRFIQGVCADIQADYGKYPNAEVEAYCGTCREEVIIEKYPEDTWEDFTTIEN